MGMSSKMEFAQKLLSNLFPSRCILCRQTVGESDVMHNIEVCSDCFKILPFNKTCCIRCALPLAEDIKNGVLCGRCITKPPVFDYCYSLFRYEDEIIHLVHQLKFAEKISYARSLGEMLFSRLQAEIQLTKEKPECLLPVPLHKSRLRQRGFNQSIEIARILAKKLGVPIEYDIVKRERSTVTQTGLNAKQRQKNIKNAFSVAGEINYKHVLIIDDVVTTGSTVNELARVLKKNKVERVGVLSIARAPIKL
jgi:ComF family protein